MISAPTGVVELLQATVRINSVNGNLRRMEWGEGELVAFLEATARRFGLETERCAVGDGAGGASSGPLAGPRANLLVLCERSARAPWLLFDSHLDTVSVEGMSIDPFAAEIRDGRLWGRGACDTKGSGAAMLWALRGYASSARRANNVALLFSLDEEQRMTGIRSFLARDYPRLGRPVAGAIVGEPTLLQPVVVHSGICRFRVTTRGLAVHASNPAAGRSAISSMVRLIDAIESRYRASLSASHPLVGRAQCSVNTIRGGTAFNVIPDRCEIEVDRRMVPGERLHEVTRTFARTLEEEKRSHPEIDYAVQSIFEAPPLDDRRSAQLLTQVQRSLSAAGLPGEARGATYATDAGDLAQAGVPAIVLGPGDIAQAHTADEWIDLGQLEQSVEVYRGIMEE